MVESSARRDPALLLDMVLAARDALSFIAGQDAFTFAASALHQNAVIRCLEVIGEAASKVSPTMRATMADVAWAEIVGMRNRLIHGYESVDVNQVWRTARDDLPLLIALLKPLIPEEENLDVRAGRPAPAFERYIGIDYSGAQTPTASLKGLRVYLAEGGAPPVEVLPPPSPRKYWSRRGVAEWLVERLGEDVPTIVGIDHGFSFPMAYFDAHRLEPDRPAFLDDFHRHWPTDGDDIWVESVRRGASGNGAERGGDTRWRRLTERRAGPAKSVFHFDVQGSVAKSTHSGLPWLRYIRQSPGGHVHFWPFDGWDIPAGRSTIAEVYPALWSLEFESAGRTADQHDAYSIAAWLSRADHSGDLAASLTPILTPDEDIMARVEGWILGVGVPHGGASK